jgi:hypothetical protein
MEEFASSDLVLLRNAPKVQKGAVTMNNDTLDKVKEVLETLQKSLQRAYNALQDQHLEIDDLKRRIVEIDDLKNRIGRPQTR